MGEAIPQKDCFRETLQLPKPRQPKPPCETAWERTGALGEPAAFTDSPLPITTRVSGPVRLRPTSFRGHLHTATSAFPQRARPLGTLFPVLSPRAPQGAAGSGPSFRHKAQAGFRTRNQEVWEAGRLSDDSRVRAPGPRDLLCRWHPHLQGRVEMRWDVPYISTPSCSY